MVELFQTTKQNVSLHINNIFKEGELTPGSIVKESLTVQKDGNRTVQRRVTYYNLDVIISVGYRVKSQRGTQFRIWATSVLRDYPLTTASCASKTDCRRKTSILNSTRNRRSSESNVQARLSIAESRQRKTIVNRWSSESRGISSLNDYADLQPVVSMVEPSTEEAVSQTDHWLNHLHDNGYLNDDQFTSLNNDIQRILRLLNAIVKSTKLKIEAAKGK